MTNSSTWAKKRIDFQWDFIDFVITLPEDSSTLTQLVVGTELSIENAHYWSSHDYGTTDFLGRFIEVSVDDSYGVEWKIPYDTIYTPPTYYNKINALDYVETNANEVLWKISGSFIVPVIKSESPRLRMLMVLTLYIIGQIDCNNILF